MKSAPKLPQTKSEKELAKNIQSLKATAKEIYASPEQTRDFFVAHGFLTKSGKLTARYRTK